jgi:Na+:H+ antiporter, NhaA family
MPTLIRRRARRLLRDRVLRPIVEFTRLEAAGGLVLLFCAVAALTWSNSPWSDSYFNLWQTPFTIGFGDSTISKPLLLWINDFLMAIFFLLVGLEIKREILVGELADMRKAALPIAAALGGMIVPAAIFAVLNVGSPAIKGWGIPMATDIAFALGVLALVGRGVPLALKVFLMALAIVDDIGAVVVIALFYSGDLDWTSLFKAAVVMVLLLGMNRFGARAPIGYAVLGLFLWFFFLKSGIHATVAGVLLASAIPARVRMDTSEFVKEGREILNQLDAEGFSSHGTVVVSEERQGAVHALERACEDIQMPLERMENSLHPYVTFGIMPLFALANAGVALGKVSFASFVEPVALGVLLGLAIGKPVGIFLFTKVSCMLGICSLPSGVGFRQVFGVGILGGIGFTMSLFIAELAFQHGGRLDQAKFGILLASLVSGIVGWAVLRKHPRAKRVVVAPAAARADASERAI